MNSGTLPDINLLWVLLTSALRALFKDFVKGNFVLKIQVIHLINAMIT